MAVFQWSCICGHCNLNFTSCSFIMRHSFGLPPLRNVKAILSTKAGRNRAVGWTWPTGRPRECPVPCSGLVQLRLTLPLAHRPRLHCHAFLRVSLVFSLLVPVWPGVRVLIDLFLVRLGRFCLQQCSQILSFYDSVSLWSFFSRILGKVPRAGLEESRVIVVSSSIIFLPNMTG